MNNVCLQISAVILSVSLVAVLSLPVGRVSKSNCNSAGVFWDKDARACKMCINCPKGYRRDIICGHGIGGIVQCIPCPSGYYQEKMGFDGTICSPCTNCAHGHMKEESICTTTSNAKCGDCLPGFAPDPNLPDDVGCTSCEHIPSHSDCQQTSNQSTTTKHSTPTPSPTSLTQTLMQISTQTLTPIPKQTPTLMKLLYIVHTTSLVPNPNSSVGPQNEKTAQESIEETDVSTQSSVNKNQVVHHGKNHVTTNTFGIMVAVFSVVLLILLIKKFSICERCVNRSRFAVCRESVDRGAHGKNGNIPQDCKIQPTRELPVISEETNSNEDSDDTGGEGEQGPLLPRPQRPEFKRSLSAPPAPGVQINTARGAVSYSKEKNIFTNNNMLAQKPMRATTSDEDIIKKAFIVSKDQTLAKMSQQMQKKICLDLNPDRSGSLVQNWKDLAQNLGISREYVDNFDRKMESVFEHMSCQYPDTSMKTFLDAVQKLGRPQVLRSICKYVISEHEESKNPV